MSSSTPIVVFAHISLWTISLEWGWGTEESEQAWSYLKRFGWVSVLNGQVHQVPIKDLAADKLRSTLGVTDASCMAKAGLLAVVDEALS